MTDDNGIAGGSARRQYERRRAADEARIRAQWGRFGGIAVALSSERQSTTAWRTGAAGEEKVGALLDSLVSARIRVLHDRKVPGSRANIDHLVVTPGGVWVVDTKAYRGRIELRVEGGIVRPRVEKLIVGGRNQTTLVEGMLWQVSRVQAAVDAPVFGALCFTGAEWSLFARPFVTRNVLVTWPGSLTRSIQATTGQCASEQLARDLARRFPAAR